jgi:hypothetical protein
MIQFSTTIPAPCRGYDFAVRFPDVDADVLAQESASEQEQGSAPAAFPWSSYLQRVLPALERNLPAEMAQAMLLNGHSPEDVRCHVVAMRRRSVVAGDVRRMRFWDDVLHVIEPAAA